MTHWKEMVKDALDAIEVVTFDYPYMSGGKRRHPLKADKHVDHHLSVVKNAVAEHPGHPLVLMGKSMGLKVSCMVASSDGINASAIICLGYPLKGAKGVMRDEILLKLMVPTMFMQILKENRMDELLGDYRNDALHPRDLKPALAKAINQILQLVRDHFKKLRSQRSLLPPLSTAGTTGPSHRLPVAHGPSQQRAQPATKAHLRCGSTANGRHLVFVLLASSALLAPKATHFDVGVGHAPSASAAGAMSSATPAFSVVVVFLRLYCFSASASGSADRDLHTGRPNLLFCPRDPVSAPGESYQCPRPEIVVIWTNWCEIV
ncbi:hypothetical protein ZWY2020_011484 [Hordeum vulgare]|nr:hypothetical protein ZWY2020_011484 [Hordeum vulgare]